MLNFFPFLFVFFWSSAFVSGQIIVQSASPFASLSFRFIIVACGFIIFAKIFKEKENKKEEEKNLNTTLLLDPSNEDATLRLMDIAVENSNYSEVKELSEKFVKICKSLCKENERILESLKDLEPKNDS